MNAPEEVPLDSERWRERYGLRQVHTQIYTQLHSQHKKTNNSRNIKETVLPFDALGSCMRGPTPIGREAGCQRSEPDMGRFCARAPASTARVLQGKVAPRRFKCPPWALTQPPPTDECAGRGPTRFREVAGATWPATGTYTNIYTIALAT